MQNPLNLVYITPQNGAILGGTIPFALLGDATMEPAMGGVGGWQLIDRPRLKAATQWYDGTVWELTLPLRLDVEVYYGTYLYPPNTPGYESRAGTVLDVERQCLEVESWSDGAVPGTLQAPVLQVTGPVPGTARRWVVYQASFKNAIRDAITTNRIAQELTLRLYEYVSAQPSLDTVPSPSFSPAAAANQQQRMNAINNALSGGATTNYTVKEGDTLGLIAANLMGAYQLWPTLAYLNNIRDPSSIYPGQVIQIPSVRNY